MRRARTGIKRSGTGLAKSGKPPRAKRRPRGKAVTRRSAQAPAAQREAARLARELNEAREQQIATADVLRVISSSPGELEPVFDTILINATRLCEAKFGHLYRWDGEAFRLVAMLNTPPALADERRRAPLRPSANEPLGRMVATKRVVHVADAAAEPAYKKRSDPGVITAVELGGIHTLLAVPMLQDDALIGALTVYRQEVRPFTDAQIGLVTNFAAQAVIAIENARLLGELRESLQQQTAAAEILRVISASPGNLEPVFQAMLEHAVRICEAKFGQLYRFDGEAFELAAGVHIPPDYAEFLRQRGRFLPPAGSQLDVAMRTKRVGYTADMAADPTPGSPARLGGARSAMAVPMLKDDRLIGAIIIYRQEVRPFTDKQIALVQNFANQAVIAIENVRLFESVEARTRELSASLENLRATQDRLVQTQKLASLGQLTAGIAHEIKNPLNFVNNFSGVSAELIDELIEALRGVTADGQLRAEIEDLARTLRDNLDKIAQHGRRADTIVRNMLLHSREGVGEHRPVDINGLVEESLNLAYHGARAEKQDFNVTLARAFDPAAGEVHIYPQEMSRVLLNLIANGFYAANQRRARDTGNDYEPTLTAATRDLGDRVEISIRDNGTGIAPEIREKMFNPFFTTKPSGEGTGLGLSISHDIVVKQHGGTIEVDSEPGAFTEIRIVLPRTAARATEPPGRT